MVHECHWLLVNYNKESTNLGRASFIDHQSTSVITACCFAIIRQRKRTISSGQGRLRQFPSALGSGLGIRLATSSLAHRYLLVFSRHIATSFRPIAISSVSISKHTLVKQALVLRSKGPPYLPKPGHYQRHTPRRRRRWRARSCYLRQ